MHGSCSFAEELANGIAEQAADITEADIVICPPAIYLHALSKQSLLSANSSISVGAQNVAPQNEGAYTGEISAGMLAEFNCTYVLVGHSERRALFSETDVQVADKFQAVQRHGMTPILCIGESLQHRESGDTFNVLAQQLEPLLDLPVEIWANAVIAYEPVWAIGTGKTASPEQAQEVHAWLRALMKDRVGNMASALQILYGGSVKPENAAMLFAQQDINGFLVGGASLKLQDFLEICRVAE